MAPTFRAKFPRSVSNLLWLYNGGPGCVRRGRVMRRLSGCRPGSPPESCHAAPAGARRPDPSPALDIAYVAARRSAGGDDASRGRHRSRERLTRPVAALARGAAAGVRPARGPRRRGAGPDRALVGRHDGRQFRIVLRLQRHRHRLRGADDDGFHDRRHRLHRAGPGARPDRRYGGEPAPRYRARRRRRGPDARARRQHVRLRRRHGHVGHDQRHRRNDILLGRFQPGLGGRRRGRREDRRAQPEPDVHRRRRNARVAGERGDGGGGAGAAARGVDRGGARLGDHRQHRPDAEGVACALRAHGGDPGGGRGDVAARSRGRLARDGGRAAARDVGRHARRRRAARGRGRCGGVVGLVPRRGRGGRRGRARRRGR